MRNYLNTFPPHRRALVERELSSVVNYSTLGLMTKAGMVEHYHNRGELDPLLETKVVSVGKTWEHYKRAKIKGINLDEYLNQLNMLNAKVTYWVNNYKVTKTVYDYAIYVKG